jgi:23S rRNA (pseudouridine1915-N3)-methyltransferase
LHSLRINRITNKVSHMKIKLICIGKTSKSFLEDGENEYLKRLQKYIPFEKIEIPDLKNVRKLTENQIKEKEGELILEKLNPGDYLILLDDKGQSFTSIQYAQHLQGLFNKGYKNILFVVGGPYGFSETIYKRANDKLSLSKMTFSHQMIRLFFIEQTYRAMTILRNEPYHHE